MIGNLTISNRLELLCEKRSGMVNMINMTVLKTRVLITYATLTMNPPNNTNGMSAGGPIDTATATEGLMHDMR